MNKQFLEYLRKDMEGKREFANLPNEEKIKMLIENGANIGKKVVIGKGTYLFCEKLEIGENSLIGEDCIFDCGEIKIGGFARIGANCNFKVYKLELGDVLYMTGNILLEGGSSNKDAILRIGKNGFIGKDAIMQASKGIIMGDNVCIGVRAILHTHGHWQNSLEGYYCAEEGITIGDDVWIGSNAIILPGVEIGEGSTITVGSAVSFDVPKKSLCAGNPAKIIVSKDYPKKMGYEAKLKLLEKFSEELVKLLLSKGFDVRQNDAGMHTAQLESKKWEIVWYDLAKKISAEKNKKIIISIQQFPKCENAYIFNLRDYTTNGKFDLLCDEIREFFRRKGIRFKPYLWRYKWVEYDE